MKHLDQQTLLTLLDYCKLGIILTDKDGTILWINDYYNSLVGHDAKRYIGQHIRIISQEALVSLPGDLLFDQTKKQQRELTSVVQYPSKDFIASTTTPVFNDSGELEYIVYSITNCSESMRMQSDLQQLDARNLALETQLNEATLSDLKSKEIIVTDEKMKKLYKIAARLAAVTTSVVITGESGVGKDIYAKYIHSISRRRDKNFIHVNLGAIPKNLFESELFGYEPGAFTGASRHGKAGLIELANGGTLFLDEVGELSLDIQAKLLQVIQERSLRRIGSSRSIMLDIRIIAATNRDLEQMVKDGTFRLDLYYRLNVISVEIPPLRERKSEIPSMAKLFLDIFNEKYHMHKSIDPAVMNILIDYAWPGNIRELNHLIENLVIISNQDMITLTMLPTAMLSSVMPKSVPFSSCTDENETDELTNYNLKKAVEHLERQLIHAALKQYKTTTAAAGAMGIDISTLSKKRKKYGI